MSVLGIIGALLIGLSLGLLGSGGSILTVPVLIYLFEQPERLAIASSLAIVGLIALAGALPNMRKRQINWRCVLLFGIPGGAGTYVGAFVSQYVSPNIQLITFAAVMLSASFFMLRSKSFEYSDTSSQRSHIKIIIDGLLVGILTGFVGVGGGFLIVPALVLLARLPMHQAIGTSLMIIALKSATGFVKYLDVLAQEQLSLNWHTITVVTLIGILGSISGNWMNSKIPQSQLKKGFALFLIPMAIFIISQNIG